MNCDKIRRMEQLISDLKDFLNSMHKYRSTVESKVKLGVLMYIIEKFEKVLMKNAILLIVLCFSFYGCEQFKPSYCAVSSVAKQQAAAYMAQRWDCDQKKVYDFLNYNCATQEKIMASYTAIACPIVVNILSKIAPQELNKMFNCNVEKVEADIEKLKTACSGFAVI
jgi:hypothetical protein